MEERLASAAFAGRVNTLADMLATLALEEKSTLADMTQRFERLAILTALESCFWNRRLAAKRLGITERTLWNKIRNLDLKELE